MGLIQRLIWCLLVVVVAQFGRVDVQPVVLLARQNNHTARSRSISDSLVAATPPPCTVALRGVLWVWRGFTHEQYCLQRSIHRLVHGMYWFWKNLEDCLVCRLERIDLLYLCKREHVQNRILQVEPVGVKILTHR